MDREFSGLAGVCRFFSLNFDDTYSVSRLAGDKRYRVFLIPKKSKGVRIIEEPCSDLKTIQKRIAGVLLKKYGKKLSPACHAYMREKSIKTNAAAHLSHSAGIAKFDLADFFGSITYQRVVGLAKTVMKFDGKAAKAFASLTSHNGHLPQGAPTSPIISNMICLSLDRRLKSYADKRRCHYTRYADDITFSSSKLENLNKILTYDKPSKTYSIDPDLISIFSSEGFQINLPKTHLVDKCHSQRITGVVVNKKLNVSRKYVRTLRAELHHASNMSEKDKKKVKNRLLGRLAYLREIRGKNDLLWAKYAKKFNEIFGSVFPESAFLLDKEEAARNFVGGIYLSGKSNGSCFFYKDFLITSRHVLEDDSENIVKSFSLRFPKESNPFPITITKYKDFNKIVVCKIENPERFFGRRLKLVESPLQESDINKPLLLLGYPKRLMRNSKPAVRESPLIDIEQGSLFYPDPGGLCGRGTIFGGMSGGPVLDPKTFEVVGVIFSGDAADLHRSGEILETKDVFSFISQKDLDAF